MMGNPFAIPDDVLDLMVSKMTPAEQVEASSKLARDYFVLTGQPLIVGEAFMAACREAGVDTTHLRLLSTLAP